MDPFIWAVVVTPHLEADLEGFFEPLVPFAQWRKWHTKPQMLSFVPCCSQPELRSASGQHVERGDRLRQESGMAIGHAAHQEPEPQPFRLRCSKGEGRVALEHRLLRRPEHLHLEPVIHHRQRAHPNGLGRLGQGGEGRTDRLRAAGPGEAGHMDVQLHVGLRKFMSRVSARSTRIRFARARADPERRSAIRLRGSPLRAGH